MAVGAALVFSSCGSGSQSDVPPVGPAGSSDSAVKAYK